MRTLKVYEGVGAQPDPLERDGELTEHDYEFLAGNTTFWPAWGAAFGVVTEWCRNHGYGDFGEPTPKGKVAMRLFETTLSG